MSADAPIVGRISGIKRAAVHDGAGLRTTVFCKGCPLRCFWCHNPESLSFRPEIGFYAEKCLACGTCANVCPADAIRMESGAPVTDRTRCTGCFRCADNCPADARIAYGTAITVDDLTRKLMQDKPFFDTSGGGVTISGGECLAQPDFTIALAERLSEVGVSVDIDTCGAVQREVIRRVQPFTDVFLYDMKAVDPTVHKSCTGSDNVMILDNLAYLLATGSRVEIRYPYVPGWNDGEAAAIGGWLAAHRFTGKVKVLGYHALADGKYAALGLPDTLPAVRVTAEDVDVPVEKLIRFGLNAVNGMRGD